MPPEIVANDRFSHFLETRLTNFSIAASGKQKYEFLWPDRNCIFSKLFENIVSSNCENMEISLAPRAASPPPTGKLIVLRKSIHCFQFYSLRDLHLILR